MPPWLGHPDRENTGFLFRASVSSRRFERNVHFDQKNTDVSEHHFAFAACELHAAPTECACIGARVRVHMCMCILFSEISHLKNQYVYTVNPEYYVCVCHEKKVVECIRIVVLYV